MDANSQIVDKGRLNELLKRHSSIAHGRKVRLGLFERGQKFFENLNAESTLRQFDRAIRILKILNRLDPRDFIEEPGAARVHQKEVTLRLESL